MINCLPLLIGALFLVNVIVKINQYLGAIAFLPVMVIYAFIITMGVSGIRGELFYNEYWDE